MWIVSEPASIYSLTLVTKLSFYAVILQISAILLFRVVVSLQKILTMNFVKHVFSDTKIASICERNELTGN